jgi:hypothetical protein
MIESQSFLGPTWIDWWLKGNMLENDAELLLDVADICGLCRLLPLPQLVPVSIEVTSEEHAPGHQCLGSPFHIVSMLFSLSQSREVGHAYIVPLPLETTRLCYLSA